MDSNSPQLGGEDWNSTASVWLRAESHLCPASCRMASKAKKAVTATIKLVINAGQAKPAPPVGPALGQAGLNIMSFCKDFNAKTGDKKVSQTSLLPTPCSIHAWKALTLRVLSTAARHPGASRNHSLQRQKLHICRSSAACCAVCQLLHVYLIMVQGSHYCFRETLPSCCAAADCRCLLLMLTIGLPS